MKQRDLWKLSLLNVTASPVRSMLTVLGFAIGVAAVLAVLTLGAAGRIQVESEMNRLGISKIWLTPAEGAQLNRGMGEWLTEVTGVQTHELIYLPVELCDQKEGIAIACGSTYLNNAQLVEGRMLWKAEWEADSQSALIGVQAAQEYSIKPGSCVGVGGRTFQICGVIKEQGEVNSISLEKAVILPLKAASRITGGAIHEIQMSASGERSVEQSQKWALRLLNGRGQQVDALNMEVQMEAASSVIFTFVNVLKWVALVCILVGGIGVMNMMLMNVRERTREIGIMKSMGTTHVQICMLFLQEALMYALLGGVTGILMGFALIGAAGNSIQLQAKANWKDCITVLGCALAAGLFFGVSPAFRASRLTCVDALRQE